LTTALITHLACLDHDMGPHHPECPDRLHAVLHALEAEEFAPLLRETAPEATIEQLTRVHPLNYVEALLAIRPELGEQVALDGDTSMGQGSAEAALRAAGAGILAVDAVMEGWARSAFAAVRPPGHHAEPDRPMGFCLFNNAAVAARHAQAAHGAERVAIVDFDVHHGNGSQAIFWDDKSVLYASTHEMPLFPGTGALSERGEHNQIVNVPLSAGDGGETFREAMDTVILPRLHDFAPDLIIISAGFDAHYRDPLGNLQLTEADFAWATRALAKIARRHAGGRIVSLLEGGYDLQGLARSAAAHVQALMES
jgi:acetoin utilization deacetylase AcuC-like enzyme